MRRLAAIVCSSTLLAIAIVAAPAPATTPTADAAGCVSITKAYYDSPGTDHGSNASLNDEFIQLRNHCSSKKSLSGWTLRDTASHVYRFGTFSLGSGDSVKVHTGSGSNTAAHRYQRSGWYIWNNDGDKAILKNGDGTTVDTCSWRGYGSGWVSC